jgi:hypothetical protein
MKKLLLGLVVCSLGVSAHAQTPEKKSIALINKLTATWCHPCGDWGWEMAHDLIAGSEGKGLFMGIYVEPDIENNDKFRNATADEFGQSFATPDYGGVPDFGINGIGEMDLPGATIPQFKTALLHIIDSFSITIPVVSPANTMAISGTTITVNAKAQFWSAASGEYYLAAYLIEDGAMNTQAGQTGIVAHHDVLRGSMSANLPFGEQIASGSIAANQTYNKTFTFNITDNTWDKAKLKVYTVIWKKNGSKYDFMNASKNAGTTGLAPIANVQGVNIYPNPTGTTATLSISSGAAMNIGIHITDITGRSVYTSENNKVLKGSNNFSLPVAQLNSGVYNVTISSKDGQMNQRLVIQK